MLAAWRWAAAQRRVELLQGGAGAIEGYFDLLGQVAFGLEVLSAGLQAIDDRLGAHQRARCRLQLSRAALAYRCGRVDDSEQAVRESLQAARRSKDRFGLISGTNTLGLVLHRLGRTKEAAFCLRDVLRRSQADGDEAATPLYQLNLSRIEIELGNEDEGERLIRGVLERLRAAGNQFGIQAAMNELCVLLHERGKPLEVLALAREWRAMCEHTCQHSHLPYIDRAVAAARFDLGDLDAATEHTRRALEALAAGGERLLEPKCRVQLARIALRRGEMSSALREPQTAARLALEMRVPTAQCVVGTAYAQWCLQQSRAQDSRRLLDIVVDQPVLTPRQRARLEAELAQRSEGASAVRTRRSACEAQQALGAALLELLDEHA